MDISEMQYDAADQITNSKNEGCEYWDTSDKFMFEKFQIGPIRDICNEVRDFFF